MSEEQNIQTQEVPAKTRITLDDVREALIIDENEAIDPFNTNASKIRKILGTGSNATIQKHLDTIREEINEQKLKASISHAALSVPVAPKELLSSIWEEAWKTAQIKTLSRIEVLTIKKDNLQQTVYAQITDISDLTESLDDLESKSNDHENQIDQIKSQTDDHVNELTQQLEIKDKDILLLQEKLEETKKDAIHAKEIAERDAVITAAAMQTTIDKLNEQVTELKAFRFVMNQMDNTNQKN